MIIEDLATELENTADWALRKAEEYPDDPRNTEAAELLTALAADLRSIVGTPEAKRFEALHAFVFDEGSTDDEDFLTHFGCVSDETSTGAGTGFASRPVDGERVPECFDGNRLRRRAIHALSGRSII